MPESPSYAVPKGREPSTPGPAAPALGGRSALDTAETSEAGGRRRGKAAPAGREGARHGRAPARESGADAAVRRRLMRLAVLPAGLVAVISAAVVGYVLRVRGGADSAGIAADSATLWGVLAGALLLCCATVVGAALVASSEGRTTVERYAALRRNAARTQSEIHTLLRRLEQGERPRRPTHGPMPEPGDDALGLLAHDVTAAQRTAEAAVVEAAALVRSTASGSEEKVEVFVNLARRLQSLVHREIELLDELENEVEDPDLLKGLFHVDHLATRMRRHAENLAVLGGAVSRRQWTRPVTLTEVLRSSIAEVEQYPRVKLVPPIEGTLRGHAVADVIHLLAELVENATVYSAPQTQVLMKAQYVTAGLAVEVEDRGLGMAPDEQNRMNALLADPEQIQVGELLQDGRIGLFVVSQLARRHGIVVQLQSNIYGGIQAVLILPHALLGEGPGPVREAGRAERPEPAAVRGAERTAIPPSHPTPPPRPAPQPAEMPSPVPVQRAAEPPHVRQVPAEGPPPPPVHTDLTHTPVTARPSAHHESDRPQLPRRRRQEHLVPELRDPPPAPRPTDEPEPQHDPGLMAAFRRGTSLAEDDPSGADSAPSSR
ncbi:ATP-binding protein [Streptomyces sp. 549]|uniref:sensor histidine kinase n=1 Tax=Streptomyces sp. 549 TaxID=3049076 RepID=UPI0024C359D2|nr:ATP-binding protein [Streptomyces sp. 549]MDK1472004.1 ATP-binding protein [Streptomyces sp. 549]